MSTTPKGNNFWEFMVSLSAVYPSVVKSGCSGSMCGNFRRILANRHLRTEHRTAAATAAGGSRKESYCIPVSSCALLGAGKLQPILPAETIIAATGPVTTDQGVRLALLMRRSAAMNERSSK
eukprot:1075411-Karenia_brevis.AAC.1